MLDAHLVGIRRRMLFPAFLLGALLAGSAAAQSEFGSKDLNFPQIVFGQGSASRVLIHNPNGKEILIFPVFFDQNANPTRFANTTVPPHGIEVFEFGPEGGLTVGWLEVTSDDPIIGTAFVRLSVAGEALPPVGVLPSPPATLARFFAFEQEDLRSGLAVSNPEQEPVQVTLRLFNRFGRIIASHMFSVGALRQRAFFLGDQVNGLSNFNGVVEARTSGSPVAIVSLTQDPQGNIGAVEVTLPNP